MKKNLIDATTNSISSLEEDFKNSSLKVIKEQEQALLEEQLIKAALDASMKNIYNTSGIPEQRAAGKPSQPSQPNRNLQTEKTIKLTLQLESMGFSPKEALQAINQCPVGSNLDTIISKITDNRDKQQYLFRLG